MYWTSDGKNGRSRWTPEKACACFSARWTFLMPRMRNPSASMRLMILPKFPLRTESGLMIVNVRFAIAARIIRGGRLVVIDRQDQRERRAAAGRRLHVDAAVMELDEVPRQRQAEARAAAARAPAELRLVELVEDPLQVVGRDADPLVAHVDAHRVDADRRRRLRHVRRGDRHRAAIRRELHRVREQVEEDLL